MSYDKTRAIIIAAGQGRRWNSHLGDGKHFITVDGETLLERSVRLLKQYECEPYLVVPYDPRYRVEGAILYHPELSPEIGDADKFLSSSNAWNQNGRTVIFYGDVFFTEDAMDKIMNYPHPDWKLFGRVGESSCTGKGHGECFAISFYHDYIPEFRAALRRVCRLYRDGVIDRNGGWEVYKAMIKMPDLVFQYIVEPMAGPKFVNIDDFTDDFDWPHDYDTWIERWRER